MVLVLLMLLFLAMVGVGLWLYTQSLLTSAAAQAARFAASADVQDTTAASRRAADIMAQTIAGRLADTVRCDPPESPDPVMIEVRCTMAAPAIVPLLDDVMPTIEVTAHALREIP
ncbi:MAG: hypothetical protein BGO26_02455 [Actinobacteria bacterium 69-20]|nr:pilus assembly protein [Actinomycetota bacterium]OJV31318.1 MAG: hypothetical protein BGO26_02455 [Actinobacteria bacterium 69-20]